MALLVQLRWMAVAGQVITIAVVHYALGFRLPMPQMGLVLGGLVLLNTATTLWLERRARVTSSALFAALLLDVGALTIQLWLSGGAANPFTSIYLLQVTIAAVLLDAFSAAVIVSVACAAVLYLTFSHRPLVHPEPARFDMFALYLAGGVVSFGLDALLLVAFVTRISGNLRERDASLAAMRQHTAEESHIVRMGLLATGAAHELGTPLSSIAVILGDWRRMKPIEANPDLRADIEEMQAAIARCKSIVTGVLLSAGEARGEAAAQTTTHALIAAIAAEWQARRATSVLAVENRLGPDIPIASDSMFKQAVTNLLDNAFEASPDHVALIAEQPGDRLRLTVRDHGPGFTPGIMAQIGKPYQSTKPRPGAGLGLFLAVTVVRKLGGQLLVRNHPSGAEVTLDLPLDALRIDRSHE